MSAPHSTSHLKSGSLRLKTKAEYIFFQICFLFVDYWVFFKYKLQKLVDDLNRYETSMTSSNGKVLSGGTSTWKQAIVEVFNPTDVVPSARTYSTVRICLGLHGNIDEVANCKLFMSPTPSNAHSDQNIHHDVRWICC